MNLRNRVARSLFANHLPVRHRLFKSNTVRATVLKLMMIVSVIPIEAASTANHIDGAPGMQSTSTLTFTAEADARVEEANSSTNYGTSAYLFVDGLSSSDIESFIRFTVSGAAGAIQSAQLRVYVTTNASGNSPGVYGANNTWTESAITWRNRPARTSGVLDNKGSVGTSTWLEYNVSPVVTVDGTYTFVLVADSADGIRFSSREGSQPPQLVITLNSTQPPATRTSTSTETSAPTESPTPTGTPASPSETTNTATQTPTRTATPGLGSILTFITSADARVVQSSPSTNYGTSTNLQADGDSGIAQISYIHFATTGISGPIRSVKLRVFCTTNGTTNGPAVYLANSNWIESGTGGITWNNRPTLSGGVVDNKTSIGTNSWVEYDVTSLVTGNGTYTFALVADSNDGVVFSSREGASDPRLVVTLGATAPTATGTATPVASQVDSPTPTETPAVSPTSTISGSVVFVGAGDISSCSNNNDEATAKLLDTIPGTVFTTGDNAYIDGSSSDYANCYDPTWGRHKARTKPVPGNHEYLTAGAAGYFSYFSNIAAYYAYDLGTWRIYALNSEISVTATSAQIAWLQDDLATHPSQCVLAYWHKPRWSSGSNHGSNSSMQALWQVLYDAGAELVINGHEHNYERFAEMNASGSAVSSGLREIVVGTGGAGLYPFSTVLSTSQTRNNNTFGVLKLTLSPGSYQWEFVPVAGATFIDSGSDTCH